MATTAVGKDCRTCKSPNRLVVFVNLGTTLIPRKLEDNSARWGCGGEPVDGPVSTQSRLDWHPPPAAIPACLLKKSPLVEEPRVAENGPFGCDVVSSFLLQRGGRCLMML
jgi:hypothetical protein